MLKNITSRSFTFRTIQECYRILQLPQNATVKQVKDNFHKLALLYHPDQQNKVETDKFIELKDAYDMLLDHLENS
jgi:DnaJ-class molecular chaperone